MFYALFFFPTCCLCRGFKFDNIDSWFFHSYFQLINTIFSRWTMANDDELDINNVPLNDKTYHLFVPIRFDPNQAALCAATENN